MEIQASTPSIIQGFPSVAFSDLPRELKDLRPELATGGVELKSLQIREIKADAEKREVTIYIAGFGSIDLGNDLILKGAALQSIQQDLPRDLIKFFWEHKFPLGPVKSLTEDDNGLLMVAKVTPDAYFDRYLAQILDKTAAHGSLGYSVREFEILTVKQVVDRYGVDAGGRPDSMLVRVIKSMRVWEGSAVIWPMNELVRVVGVKNRGKLMEKKSLYDLARVIECQDTINWLTSAEWAALSDEEIAQAQELLELMQRAEKQLSAAIAQRQTKTVVSPALQEAKTVPSASPIATDSLSDQDLETIADLLVDVKSVRRDLVN